MNDIKDRVFSFIPGHTLGGGEDEDQDAGFQRRLERFLATSKEGLILELANCFLSAVACLLFVVETYGTVYSKIELGLVVLFGMDYVMRLVAAKKKLSYLLSWPALIDLVTILPLFVYYGKEDSEETLILVFRFLRVLRILRITRATRLLQYMDSEVSQQIFSMALTVVSIMFVAAGLLHLVENMEHLRPEADDDDGFDGLPFHDIVYLIITTITTVGYGDLSPVTIPGRVAVMVMMCTALVLVPRQTNKLIAIMAMSSVYGRQRYKATAHSSHVIVCGAVHAAGVVEFFTELFHPDHGHVDRVAVVLAKGLPSPDMHQLLADPNYALGLTYLDGNVMNEKDLKRAVAQSAKCVFVLTNKFSQEPDEEDASTILRALSVKRFVQQEAARDVMTCVQLIRPESKKLFLSLIQSERQMASRDHIVCIEEIKMNLLAKTCLCPGLNTMVFNLISSSGDPEGESEFAWLNEYTQGVGYEIYRVPLAPSFSGRTFLEAAQIVYDETESILFALELNPPDNASRVILNPGQLVVPDAATYNLHGFVIAEDKKEAEVVSSFSMSTPALQPRPLSSTPSGSPANRVVPTAAGAEPTGPAEPPKKKNTINLGSLMRKNKNKQQEAAAADSLQREVRLEDMYHLHEHPVSLADATLRSVAEDRPSLTNHVLVIGRLSDLYHFILPLRAKHLNVVQPIVILHPRPPGPKTWEKIAHFTEVYYVRGSPLEWEDLQRAGVGAASRAVIFAKEYDSSEGSLEALVDADTIFSYRVLSKTNDSIQIVCELVTQSNISFLTGGSSSAVQENPVFAAGHCYTSTMLDTLVCQAFYNGHILTVVNQLVSGGDLIANARWTKAMSKKLGAFSDSHLWSMPVPPEFHNRTYGELFRYLTSERGMIPLGLRRGVMSRVRIGQKGNRLEYVFTNPSHTDDVYRCDTLFILSPTAPEDGNNKTSLAGVAAHAQKTKQLVDQNVEASAREVLFALRDEMRLQIQTLRSDIEAVASAAMRLEGAAVSGPPL